VFDFVVGESVLAIALVEGSQLLSMIFKFQDRDAEAARVGYPIQMNENKGPNPDFRLKQTFEALEFTMICFNDLPASVKSHDHWRSFESAHHYYDSAIFSQMGNGFDTAAD
jgi:hypothetical protein